MALTDENGGMSTTMLVSPTNGINTAQPYPVYMNGQNGSNNGGFGDGNSWWVVLLIILLAMGGWNNNGNNGGGFGGQPIILNDGGNGGNCGNVQRGFDQAAIMSGLNGIQNNVQGLSTQLCDCCGNIQTSLCNGFAGVNATVNSGFANAEVANNARQMANMQTAFGMQTAMTGGFNALQNQLCDCCSDNRLGIADLKYTVATENCADRAAVSDGIRDVIANNTANSQTVLNAINGGIQSIKDQLCQDKIDAKNDTIAQLRQEVLFARGQASQDVQTAALRQSDATTANQLIAELRSCPIPSMPVYGMQPIFTCNQNPCGCNNGCGCGCN